MIIFHIIISILYFCIQTILKKLGMFLKIQLLLLLQNFYQSFLFVNVLNVFKSTLNVLLIIRDTIGLYLKGPSRCIIKKNIYFSAVMFKL